MQRFLHELFGFCNMMKKLILVTIALIGLISCSTDLSGIEEKLSFLEKEGSNLENEYEKAKDASDKLGQESEALEAEVKKRQEENEKIRQQLAALEDSLNTVEPKLLSMEFVAADNPLQLIENVKCEIIGDSAVECRILNITSSKVLIPRFTFQGSVVTINGEEVESGVSMIDFSEPVVLSIITSKTIKDYTVYVGAYTGLPTVWIETNTHKDIDVAGQFYNGKIKMAGNPGTSSNGYITQANAKIMAVGTIYWYRSRIHEDMQLGKNAYSVLFNDDISLLDSPAGKTWEFYTNTSEKTMLHNQTAFYLGSMSALEYTPRFYHVNLLMNGRYYGTYLMGEDMEVSEGRVNVGSDGFLLGIGASSSGPVFSTSYLERAVSVIAPSASQSEASVDYISNFVTTAENALFSSDFTDASEGWQKYMDIDSFVDWYLINEISKNENGAFRNNCMMNLTRGGKLKMGPLWDFEKAFSVDSSPSGFVIKDVNWYARLFKDPAFVAKVKERYDFFYSHKNDIITEISNTAEYLKYAIQEDNNKWNTFTTASNSGEQAWLLYQTTVYSMEKWLNSRMDWLKGEFDAMA